MAKPNDLREKKSPTERKRDREHFIDMPFLKRLNIANGSGFVEPPSFFYFRSVWELNRQMER